MSEDEDSGTDSSTDSNWKTKYGPEPWKNPDRLQEMCYEKDMSQVQIGRRFDITQQAVSYWLDKFDIKAERDRSISQSKERDDGRTQYHVPDGNGGYATFYESNLVALLDNDPHEVFSPDIEVHHWMNSPARINHPENLEPLDSKTHQQMHAEGEATIDHEIILDRINPRVLGDRPSPEQQRKRFQLRMRHNRQRMNG